MNKKIMLLAVVLIIISPSVLALGVTPGKITIDFEPNMETTISLTVLNNDQKDFTTLALVEGDLKDYVTIENARLDFRKEEASKTVSYKVKLPRTLDKPGTHQTMIKIRELKESEEAGPITIGASLEVISLLLINVPYEGKYVRAEMFISEGGLGEETVFAISAENVGEEDVNSISAKIDIYNADGEKITTLSTDEISLNTRNKRELVARWTAEKPGRYKAKATLSYDGKTTILEKEIMIGGFLLKLHDITVKNFKLGGIAKFQILVENIGSELIKESYSHMKLQDEKGKTIMDLESNRKGVEAEEKKELEAYWETENVEKGSYEGSITLKYEDKQSTKPIRTTVKDDSIETHVMAGTGMAIAPTGKPKSNVALTALIIALIAINIGWLIYFKRKKR